MSCNYVLRSISVKLQSPKLWELSASVAEIRKTFNLAKAQGIQTGTTDYQHLPRKRARITYLKSRFKHRKAIRHYVFEQCCYQVNVYGPFDVKAVVSTILGSLRSSVTANCNFVWSYPRLTSPSQARQEDRVVNSICERIKGKLGGCC